ncbi:MAG: hypothetical protein ACOCX4_07955 [Planctomycetota bacterium]
MAGTNSNPLTDDLRAIQDLLRRAADETGAVADAASGRPKVRFRKRTAMQVLRCIVNLDSQLAEIHTLRQRILAHEAERASAQN